MRNDPATRARRAVLECVSDEAEGRRCLAARSRTGTGTSDADWEVYARRRESYERFSAVELRHQGAIDSRQAAARIAARTERKLGPR